MPPNGWRCRCRAIEVAAYNYNKTDSKTAMKAGEKATTQISKSGKNSLEMFRFNPGKARQIFPKNNAYNPKNCDGGKINLSGLIGYSKIILFLENERCRAKKLIEEKAGKINERKIANKKLIEWAHSHIKRGSHITFSGEQFSHEVRVSRSCVENIVTHIPDVADKDIVKDFHKIITESSFSHSAELGEGMDKSSKNIGRKRARGVTEYRYYKSVWNGRNVLINMEVMKDGYEQPYAFLLDKE